MPVRNTESVLVNHRLRRKRSLSVNHVERHALREGKGPILSKLGWRGVLDYRAPESWNMIWSRRGGHIDP